MSVEMLPIWFLGITSLLENQRSLLGTLNWIHISFHFYEDYLLMLPQTTQPKWTALSWQLCTFHTLSQTYINQPCNNFAMLFLANQYEFWPLANVANWLRSLKGWSMSKKDMVIFFSRILNGWLQFKTTNLHQVISLKIIHSALY